MRVNAVSNPSLNPEKIQELSQKYFSKDWKTDHDRNNIIIRRALLESPYQDSDTVNSTDKGFDNYIPALARNPQLSPERINEIYFESIPKGGLQSFVNNVNNMPGNEKLVKKLSEKRFYSGAKWQETLRQEVNKEFYSNLYDPVQSVSFMHEKYADYRTRDLRKLSLYAIEDEEEFFSKKDRDIAAANEITTFNEYFEGSIEDAVPMAVVNTADEIVDDVMEKLVPAMEHSLNVYDKEKKAYKGDVTVFILEDLVLDDDFYKNTVFKLGGIAK